MPGKLIINAGKLLISAAAKVARSLACCCGTPVPCPYFCSRPEADRFIEVTLNFDVITGTCCLLGNLGGTEGDIWAKVISFPASLTVIAEPDPTYAGIVGGGGCIFKGCLDLSALSDVEVELYTDSACTIPFEPFGHTDYRVKEICVQWFDHDQGFLDAGLFVSIRVQRLSNGAQIGDGFGVVIPKASFTLTGCCYAVTYENALPREIEIDTSHEEWDPELEEYVWVESSITKCANPIVVDGLVSICSFPIEEI